MPEILIELERDICDFCGRNRLCFNGACRSCQASFEEKNND